MSRVWNRLRTERRNWIFRSLLNNWREASIAARRHTLGVTLSLKNGMTIRGGERDDTVGIFHEIFVDRCYTPRWFYTPRPGQLVLDVGANIGIFSLFLHAVAPSIRVVAFEPHPTTYGQLTRNLAENRLDAKVSSHQLAVAGGPGEVRFALPSGPDEREFGHQAATSSGQGRSVPCIGLAEVLAMAGRAAVDLLKVDTEGAEAEIITNAPAAVWSEIARVVIEYHDHTKRDQVQRHLTEVGYQCHVVPARGFEHHLGLIYAYRP